MNFPNFDFDFGNLSRAVYINEELPKNVLGFLELPCDVATFFLRLQRNFPNIQRKILARTIFALISHRKVQST